MKNLVEQFKNEWKQLCDSNFKKFGDKGSCVIGASVKINNEEVDAIDVCKVQGSFVWESGLTELMQKYRDEYNLKISYNPGMLD